MRVISPVWGDKTDAIHSVSIVLVIVLLAIFISTCKIEFYLFDTGKYRKMGKYAKIRVKMLKKQTLSVPTFHILPLSRSRKLVHVSGFQKDLFCSAKVIQIHIFAE